MTLVMTAALCYDRKNTRNGESAMNAAQRREYIMKRLNEAAQPVSATALAGELSVSRQIIVGDVALLRAAGEAVVATPRGYVIERHQGGPRYTVACRHDHTGVEQELNLMVDHGCTVENVIVEHSVYGQLMGRLDISSRYDVKDFIRKVEENGAKPLSDLTGGIHLHTLICPSEGVYHALLAALREAGLLVE